MLVVYANKLNNYVFPLCQESVISLLPYDGLTWKFVFGLDILRKEYHIRHMLKQLSCRPIKPNSSINLFTLLNISIFTILTL